MSIVYLISIAIRVAAFVWSLLALGRHREWKMGLLAICVSYTTVNQVLSGVRDTEFWSVGFIKETGWFGLIVSVLVFACVCALDRVLSDAQQTRSRLKISEENLVEFASNMQDVLWIVSADRKQFFYVSPAFEKLWGRTEDELYANAALWLEGVQPEESQQVSLAYAAVLDDKFIDVEYRVVRSDGAVIWVCDRGTAVLDQRGNIQRLVGTTEDISLRKRAQTEVLRAKEAAETANRTKNEFVANMSHEMRNPLTAVLGYTELLLEENRGCTDTVDKLQTIKRHGLHLLDVINDILDLSKMEAGKLTIHDTLVSPAEIVSDVVSLVRAAAEQKHLPLTTACEGGVPAVIHVDRQRVARILVNLASNAIKFTSQGSVRIVTRSGVCERGHTTIEFEVIDTGVGMSAEDTKKLFQPFHQVDASHTRQHGGAGLGLAISGRLAQRMGGEIRVKTKQGAGSRFCLTLPVGGVPTDKLIYDTDATSSESARDIDSADKKEAVRLDCRLLLAEDSGDNQRLIASLLQNAGAAVTVAENGAIAVRQIIDAWESGRPYHVVLMDVQMPVLDGLSATRRLRDRCYDLPILALTANAMTGDRETCLQSGCDDYMSKPIDRQRLLTLVARYSKVAMSQIEKSAS